ncbi:ATP-binding protein [Infirmifilum sp. NZ]|uniref:ATP-binding protein n=1 Tax=Infirmifilum sp. NZ TaxID=2926850 RepID=UPI0027AAAE0B|nr:ATP-binding protein [Infirmifilum sp. NZ]UNQ73410.1 DUF853 family protein [Infirmifilum sp. NZ]
MDNRGLFLGFRLDSETLKPTGERYTLDSNSLTSHAAVFGMTGSGKTGLAAVLVEELLLSGVPVLAVDPKGDLASLALRIPGYRPEGFKPWVGERRAGEVAELWRKGVEDSGLSLKDAERLFGGSEVLVLTPGSTAGVPVSILGALSPPEGSDDPRVVAERAGSVADALLSLAGVRGPLESRGHALLSSIIAWAWGRGERLDFGKLVSLVLNPPFRSVGAMGLEEFMGEGERRRLAAELNRVLASPGFEAWLAGVPLDFDRLLWAEDGRPRAVVFYLAHLDERWRMFAVTLLLQALYGWMQARGGSERLRALLLFDEVYGFVPPHPASPPSKRLLMLLVKQARAFGLGVVLATQNPVDVDYKVLGNAATWLIGRLQTQNDVKRVLEGLRLAAGAPPGVEDLVMRLPRRAFLVRSALSESVDVFTTRWAMTYLHGPMTLSEVARLSGGQPRGAPQMKPAAEGLLPSPPEVYQGFAQAFVEPASEPRGGGVPFYKPLLAGVAVVELSRARPPLSLTLEVWGVADPLRSHAPAFTADGPDPRPLLAASSSEWRRGFAFTPLPGSYARRATYERVLAAFKSFARERGAVSLLHARKLSAYSRPGESEQAFLERIRAKCESRLRARVREIEERYARRAEELLAAVKRREEQLARRRAELEKLLADLGAAGLDTVLSLPKPTTLVRRAARLESLRRKVEGKRLQVSALEAEVERLRGEVAELKARKDRELEDALKELEACLDVERVTVRPTAKEVRVTFLGLIWIPHLRTSEGELALHGAIIH